MNTFRLTVSTPDGNRYDSDAVSLFVRGAEGDLAILANHVPFVTAVKGGICRIITAGGEELKSEISGGLLVVSEGGRTVLMTSSYTSV